MKNTSLLPPARLRKATLATMACLALGLIGTDAQALALGRISVQSALGEPLRAQVEIPDINDEERASLQAGIASQEAFRAAGLEYNALLSAVRVTPLRRADGRTVLQIQSDRPVSDPFLDLILEANWAAGRVSRGYTLLLDPPNLRAAASPAPTPAQVSIAPSPAVLPTPAPAAIATPAPVAAPTPGAAPAPLPARAAEPTRPVARPASVAATPAPSATGDRQVTVRKGDTAGKIAAANALTDVSLDQMLVALLRTNPDAFIGNNVNRLRTGSVLNLPSAEQALATPSGQARQAITVQSRDFNEFRRRLATAAPATETAAADRRSSGKVQTQVQEKNPAAGLPDKLTLSKGSVKGQTTEDKIAREREAKEAAARAAELSKNISDLKKLGAASAPAGSAATGAAARPAASAATPTLPPLPVAAALPAASSPAAAAPMPVPVASSAPPVASAAPPAASLPAPVASAAPPAASLPAPAASAAPSQASSPLASGSAAVAPAPASRPAVKQVAPPPPEPGLLDTLTDNPMILAAAGGLVALLGGFGFYRLRQRKKAQQADSALDSRLQPDSFFGSSGGQQVDTHEESVATGSSMVYSPSQLDAAGDVDPVAEADVYLAYGRDKQAEDILKDALRSNPTRVAIHAKLLEVHAKHKEVQAFNELAEKAHELTKGEGPEWNHIAQMGRELDPANALYQTDAAEPGTAEHERTAPVPLQADAGPATAPPSELDLDLDLDLDFPAAAPTAAADSAAVTLEFPSATPTPAPAPELDEIPSVLNMDFEMPEAAPTPAPAPVASADFELDLPDLGLPDMAAETPAPPAPVAAPTAAASADDGMLEFDLGSLSLDLGDDATPAAGAATSDAGDPLATKLSLAEEFHAIGDDDGARTLVEEVIAESSGAIRARAQRLLAELS